MKKVLQDKKFWIYTLVVWAVGILGGLFALDARAYYAELALPSFAPPGWLFGPVWTILYLLMGISLYIITKMENQKERKVLLTLFAVQFVLNFIWTPIFFVLESNLWAVIVITVLWLVLVAFQLAALKNKQIVMWLMGPYFLWVSFASVLAYSVLFLN